MERVYFTSHRRRQRLEGCLEEARAQAVRPAQEREHPDPGISQREERAAKERQQRTQATGDQQTTGPAPRQGDIP